jgi:aryl-alcohol dehydrogenase-like predicted oxidoreductase
MVSRFGMGLLTIAESHLSLSPTDGSELLIYAAKQGINFFDTAEYYAANHFLRDALPKMDTPPTISSKSLARDYNGMLRDVENACNVLDLDFIDIFLLHEVRNGNDLHDRSAAWKCLCDLKHDGNVGAIGLSTHHTDVVEACATSSETDVIFALMNKDSLGIRTGEFVGTRESMGKALYKNHATGKGIYLMKVFGGGNLITDYREALDYATSLPFADSIIIGMGSEKEIDDLIAYDNNSLPADFKVDTSSKKIRIVKDDCEGCGGCALRCPTNAIELIPDAENTTCAVIDYDKCIACGYCAPVCPVRAIIFL